jgi:hypothetical protein
MKELTAEWTNVTLQEFIELNSEDLSHIEGLLMDECACTPESHILLAKIRILQHCTL